jgi:hypothetical protein
VVVTQRVKEREGGGRKRRDERGSSSHVTSTNQTRTARTGAGYSCLLEKRRTKKGARKNVDTGAIAQRAPKALLVASKKKGFFSCLYPQGLDALDEGEEAHEAEHAQHRDRRAANGPRQDVPRGHDEEVEAVEGARLRVREVPEAAQRATKKSRTILTGDARGGTGNKAPTLSLSLSSFLGENRRPCNPLSGLVALLRLLKHEGVCEAAHRSGW